MGADIRNVGLQIEPGGFMQPLREHPGFGSILNRDRALTQPVDDPDRILNPCCSFAPRNCTVHTDCVRCLVVVAGLVVKAGLS